MPVTKSAIKTLRSQRKKAQSNEVIRAKVNRVLRSAKKGVNQTLLQEGFSLLDKAAKAHIMHENKASRLKARLARLVVASESKKTAAKKVPKSSQAASA